MNLNLIIKDRIFAYLFHMLLTTHRKINEKRKRKQQNVLIHKVIKREKTTSILRLEGMQRKVTKLIKNVKDYIYREIREIKNSYFTRQKNEK